MSKREERKREAVDAAKHRMDAFLGHIWWAILLRGLLAVGLAICAFVWPEKTVGIFVKLLGAYFLIDGIIGAVGAMRSSDKGTPLLQTIASLLIGLLLLFWTGVSVRVFLILVGAWLALQGISLLLAAYKMPKNDETRMLTISIGGIMAVIGGVFVFWSDTGVVAISWLIGIGAAIVGSLLIFLAMRVKQFRSRVQQVGKTN